jgi:superfamily I DNA/RNA helicase
MYSVVENMTEQKLVAQATEFVKINGPPGTGKTTKLMNEMLGLLKAGADIKEIAFMGFTRASCDEALKRARALVPEMEADKRYWFRTIHATCFYLCIKRGLFIKKKVVDYQASKAFCDAVGLSPPSLDDDNVEGGEVSTGTAFFSTLSYLVNTFTPMSEFEKCPHAGALAGMNFEDLSNAWKKFKKDRNLIDFNDMLTTAYGYKVHLPVKYLFADEHQDDSPLQDAIVKMFAQGKKKVWIAGDANQSIYEFQGANPKLLLDFKVNEEVTLPRSYRVPENIWLKAQELIKMNEFRTKTEDVTSNGPGGQYIWLKGVDPRHVEKIMAHVNGEVFILFRTNYHCKKFSWKLAENGILFKNIDGEKEKMFGWNKKKVEFVNKIFGATSDPYKRNRILEEEGNALKMNQYAIKFLQYYVRHSGLIDPSKIKVKIGTIHSAKGREADTVIIFDNVTGRVMDGMETQEGMEAERRCWYVGITRARKKLCIVHDYFSWIGNTGVFPLPE